jgi:hypothetical protein
MSRNSEKPHLNLEIARAISYWNYATTHVRIMELISLFNIE